MEVLGKGALVDELGALLFGRLGAADQVDVGVGGKTSPGLVHLDARGLLRAAPIGSARQLTARSASVTSGVGGRGAPGHNAGARLHRGQRVVQLHPTCPLSHGCGCR